MAASGLVWFSSKTTAPFFAIIAFSFVMFISRTYGQPCVLDVHCQPSESCCNNRCVYASSCLYMSCSKNSDCSANQACCGSRCVKGSSCLGLDCTTNFDCFKDQTCCNYICVHGNSCVGQKCSINGECAVGQSCCTGKCKDGLGCIGEPCSGYGDCQDIESCCKGTCSKGDCVTPLLLYIIFPAAAFVIAAIVISAIVVFRRRQRRLSLMGAAIPANILTNSTIPSATVSVTQCNPLYQPEGPPSDHPIEQPPPYTATPNQGFGWMNPAPQTDPLASAAERKTTGVV